MIEENYQPKQKYKLSATYLSRYEGLKKFAETEFTVLSVEKKLIARGALSESSRHIYEARYGLCKEYPIFELIVLFDGDEQNFMLSQFGVR